MSDIPAGWYDNPEVPSQHRYWDGTAWTDHTAPKAPPSGSNGHQSVGQVVSDMFSLVGRCWRQLVVLALPMLLLTAVGFGLLWFGADRAVNPGISEILDRVTEPGFDSTTNPADDAFLDSIDVDIDATAAVAGVIGAAVLMIAGAVPFVMMAVQLASTQAGRPLSIGATISASMRRLPRIIGVSLLWWVVGLLVMVPITLLAVIEPITLLLLVPASIGIGIFLFPYVMMASVKLLVGPREQPPARATIDFMRGRWGSIAVRILVMNLVLIAVNVATSAVTAPLSVASLAAGFIAGWLLGLVQNALNVAGLVVVYDWGGGEYDESILAPVSADTPPR